jgi:uncharacterized protein (DUF433 family)
MTFAFQTSPLAAGAYTLPDAARILGQPLASLRRWVSGIPNEAASKPRHHPAGKLASRDIGRDQHIDFYTLIELFTVAELRKAGLSMKTLRQSREELVQSFKTPYPFALKGLLVNGKKLLKELGNEALLELGTKGQTVFEEIIKPFCQKIDFDTTSNLASCYYPKGKEVPILVSPNHAFGRPVIKGTNIPTETIACLLRGGETPEDIAFGYQLTVEEIACVQKFELDLAA